MPCARYLLLILACLGLFTVGANASISIPDGWTPYAETLSQQAFDYTFGGLTETAEILCQVYETNADTGKYAYTYQINNTSDVDLSFISIQILNGVNIAGSGVIKDEDSDEVLPDIWGTAGSPMQSFNGHFSDTIVSGGKSALLWFVSDGIPTDTGIGSLFGAYRVTEGDSWAPIYAKGTLITPAPVPVPEPATLLLISMGTFAIIGRRKGSQEAV